MKGFYERYIMSQKWLKKKSFLIERVTFSVLIDKPEIELHNNLNNFKIVVFNLWIIMLVFLCYYENIFYFLI